MLLYLLATARCAPRLTPYSSIATEHCGDGRCLVEAAYTSNVAAVREILETGLEKVDARATGGRTALHRVGYEPDSRSDPMAAETAAILLKHGANVNVRDTFGYTPLFFAAATGYMIVAQLLIEHGAQIDLQEIEHQRTSLMLATLNGHHEVVAVLLQRGANQNLQDKHGFSALLLGASNLHKPAWRKLTSTLLAEKLAPIDAVENQGRTALMYAAQAGAKDTVSELLQHGANINLQDKDGRTALSWAVLGKTTDHEETASVLREAAVDRKMKEHTAWLEETGGGGEEL
jgi:ankyrin repeat protein